MAEVKVPFLLTHLISETHFALNNNYIFVQTCQKIYYCTCYIVFTKLIYFKRDDKTLVLSNKEEKYKYKLKLDMKICSSLYMRISEVTYENTRNENKKNLLMTEGYYYRPLMLLTFYDNQESFSFDQ